jgi:hypothetical protein
MTKQEQSAFIINKLGDQLKDQPNVEYTLGLIFAEWFAAKAEAGLSMIVPTDQSNAAPPPEGGGGGGPNSQTAPAPPAPAPVQ